MVNRYKRRRPRESADESVGGGAVPAGVQGHVGPPFVDQLLSDESLKKTGYFNIEAVRFWRDKVRNRQLRRVEKSSVELGMVAVVTTQLWHHLFIDGSLADLDSQAHRPKLASVG